MAGFDGLEFDGVLECWFVGVDGVVDLTKSSLA